MKTNFKLSPLLLPLIIGLSYERSVDNTIPLSIANNHFCLTLLRQLFDDQKNIFFSPFSIGSAFGVVYTGAKGKTAEELQTVLGYKFAKLSEQQLKEQISKVYEQIDGKNNKKYELNIANKIVVQKEFPFLKTFQEIVEKYFKSSIESKNFNENPKAVMNSINEWVSKQTKDKIKTILSKPLDSSAKMVILNAIYFKGLFNHKFDPKKTREEVFFNGGKTEKKTQMMRRTGKFNYTEIPELESKLLEMPYSGDDISLYIVLPNQRQGLKTLNDRLKDFKTIEKSISSLRSVEVVVSFPKFKVETNYNLNEKLSEIGVKKLLTKSAELSKINGKNNLYVSQSIHKAYIEVTEEGTEAAAVTAVIISAKKMTINKKQIVFRADHPFLYFIRHNTNGMILFCGQLNQI